MTAAQTAHSLPLPPLPPVPVGALPGGRTMIDMLASAHTVLEDLCDRLATSSDRTAVPSRWADHGESRWTPDVRVRDVLVAELTRHLSAEEQYLYPSVRAVVPAGDDLADREVAEDLALLRVLRRLAGEPPGTARYHLVLREVAQRLRGHIDRCQARLFPAIATMVTQADQIRLGNRVSIALEAAPTRPHPSTPMAPPMNKITDPLVAIVDKARDVLSGRTTYADDLPA